MIEWKKESLPMPYRHILTKSLPYMHYLCQFGDTMYFPREIVCVTMDLYKLPIAERQRFVHLAGELLIMGDHDHT